MSGPQPERFPFLDQSGIIPFAHRGGNTQAPENTVAAFTHATRLGYRYLETDVHRTADGVLVAFHDTGLQRFVGDTRAVVDCDWAELCEVPLDFSRLDGTVETHRIPTMDELFEEFPDARFNIDPKEDSAVELLAATIKKHKALDRVCIGAFSDARLQRMRRILGPRLCTSPGPRSIVSAILPWPLPGEHPCVSIPSTIGSVSLNARLVQRFKRQGYRVHVWTVNDEAEMHKMIDLGVDGIMTDNCPLLKTVMQDRAVWPG